MPSSLNLIIKTTRKCNLRCNYCHDWRSRGRPISFEVLAHLTAKALGATDQKVVNFIWHGGEPLLLGEEFFARALALQKEFLNPGQYVINSIQTNGTVLTPEWCDFLARNRFTLGISIDGPRAIHDLNRTYANGRSSYDDVLRAIELAREKNMQYGVLLVLNQNTGRLPVGEIFDFVLNELGVKQFSFLPAVPDNIPGEFSGETETTDFFPMAEYDSFMKKVFDHWYALGDPEVNIREIDGIMRSLMQGNPRVCTLSGGCIGENFHIEAQGDVYHCDKYVGDRTYHLGNILDTDFDAIRGGTKLRGLVADEEARLAKLRACPNFAVCHGGCPHDRYIARKYDPTHDGRCCGQASLIEHIRGRIAGDIPAELEIA